MGLSQVVVDMNLIEYYVRSATVTLVEVITKTCHQISIHN